MKKLLVAVSRNYVIGVHNQLPWKKIPEDLNFFKLMTENHIVIMGYNTWVSIGRKPLPKRKNVVIGRGTPDLTNDTRIKHCPQLTKDYLRYLEDKYPYSFADMENILKDVKNRTSPIAYKITNKINFELNSSTKDYIEEVRKKVEK